MLRSQCQAWRLPEADFEPQFLVLESLEVGL